MKLLARLRLNLSLMISQFGCVGGALRFFRKGLVRLTEIYLVPSFSQFGEDRLLSQFLGSVRGGLYVEVGCNDPVRLSNTWTLYERGWSGLVIDANPDCIRKFKRVRPRDIAICSVVSDSGHEVDFYFCDEPLISGIGAKTDGAWQRTNRNARIEKRSVVRLDELIGEHLEGQAIDLLCVDVEGHELQVLSSLDLAETSPTLILVEMHDFDLKRQKGSPVYRHLLQYGYDLKAFDGVNGYFLKGQ